MALPFIWMLLSSFKTESEALAVPPTLFPKTFSFQSYIGLFERLDFGVYLTNTLIVVLFSMLGLLLDTMAGYAFAKFRFRGNRALFVLVLATMMIPGQVKMIPMYIIVSEMNLTNTMAGNSRAGVGLQHFSGAAVHVYHPRRAAGSGEIGRRGRVPDFCHHDFGLVQIRAGGAGHFHLYRGMEQLSVAAHRRK
ncbi:hypothetical protein PbDSM24746_30960 [Paenibacillus macerans]|nr:hypothetical protein PbDSM24746_30960 [Paenibacillus macerans]GBK69405.1 hypothetical protein PbJCM17693_31130 [Paenibacillus macerans]